MRIPNFKTEQEMENFFTECKDYFQKGQLVRTMTETHGVNVINNEFVTLEIKPSFERKFESLIKSYPSTENQKYETHYDIDFKIDIKNGVRDIEFQISYIHKGVKIYVRLDNFTEIMKNEGFIIYSTRKVYDSEYHYFPGYSATKLKDMTIGCLMFNTNKVTRWYGGDVTLKDEELQKKILNFVTEHY